MNFISTLKSAKLVIKTNEVPLIVGESGIGKTALAKKLAEDENLNLVSIDGNLLKEGEIGGLPTIESYETLDESGKRIYKKSTVYAVHTKLREIDNYILNNKGVLLFIDEINRCEHTVQQELMNLILNREINGYNLSKEVKIIAAMNPSGKYGEDFDYQVVDMDAAQENRFVWLRMESDSENWINWAIKNNINNKVIEFISNFPQYLYKKNEEDVDATPRSYERISKILNIYRENKDLIEREVLLNVLKGNVGRVIAQELISFIESNAKELISFDDVFFGDVISQNIIDRVKKESHTRLYLAATNILVKLNNKIKNIKEDEISYYINRFIEFINYYPADLMVGIMKDMKNTYNTIYEKALDNDKFIEGYFKCYKE
ncbi:ATP-binding protein [Clostridium sp. HCP1S3_B4]|uniref:ATP-binding protein n=1 Tax=unclassified Clostridium TaxID=2614128 RepID=UPI0016BC075E|nr:ATP-binding protein [Clostridium sp.]NLK24135.1 ATP-binding protein [Clostridiales bacterium]